MPFANAIIGKTPPYLRSLLNISNSDSNLCSGKFISMVISATVVGKYFFVCHSEIVSATFEISALNEEIQF